MSRYTRIPVECIKNMCEMLIHCMQLCSSTVPCCLLSLFGFSANNIVHGKASGIAVMEKGGGTITGLGSSRLGSSSTDSRFVAFSADNFIAFNKWSGIDIRKRACPYVARNFLCGGYSDGMVVGEGGSGVILLNVIHANSGCGVWLKSPAAPLLHGNQICYNSCHGVGFQAEGSGAVGSAQHTDADVVRATPNLPLPPGAPETESDKADDAQDDLLLLRNRGRLTVLEYNSIYCNSGSGLVRQLSRYSNSFPTTITFIVAFGRTQQK